MQITEELKKSVCKERGQHAKEIAKWTKLPQFLKLTHQHFGGQTHLLLRHNRKRLEAKFCKDCSVLDTAKAAYFSVKKSLETKSSKRHPEYKPATQ